MPRIVFKNNEHPPVDLGKPVTLGRSAQQSDVVLDDNRLSRAHCRFEPAEGGWAVRDLDSQNGTFLNGKRVQSAVLKPGDVITIGACDMTLEESAPARTSVKVGGPRDGALDFADDEAPAPMPEDTFSTRTVVAPAALVLKQGSLSEAIHPITKDEFRIGRKHDNDLCLEDDGKASGYHARIYRKDDEYFIEDLGSTNGVLVNGTQIEGAVRLKNGMKVVLGRQLFRFEIQGRVPQSSGRTKPVRARQAPAPADLDETDVAEEPQPAPDPEDDTSALNRKVKYKGGGSALFKGVEAIVVIAVAGAILFAAWTMLKDDRQVQGADGDGAPPAADGGLLEVNPSFEDAGDGEFPRGWSYYVSGADAFNVVRGAHGGRNAVQISRFNNANEASYLLSETFPLEGQGLNISAWALNNEASSGRMGTALVSVFWYAHADDREPMLVSPVAVRSGMADWTELSGSVRAPSGAEAWAVSLSMLGKAGGVTFDDVSVTRNDEADDWFQAHSAEVPGGLEWGIATDGGVSLRSGENELLRGGRFQIFQGAAAGDPLDVMSVLNRAPEVSVGEGGITASFRYFDPLAEGPMLLVVELKGREGNATLNAEIRTEGGSTVGAGDQLAFNVLATPAWAPAELVRFETRDGRPMDYRSEIGVRNGSPAEIGVLLSSNTGTGNRIIAPDDSRTRVAATTRRAARELFLRAPGTLSIAFEPGSGVDELDRRVSLVAEVQIDEDQTDRVERALSIFRDFLYNQPEVAAAAAAIDAASKHYGLRLTELRDGINVPQLTRNEQLYRNAMREAIANSEALSGRADGWREAASGILRAAGGDGMNDHTKAAANLARASLNDLVEIADDFQELAELARRGLFALEIEIEQRESESYIASARDFLDAGQYVQGMVKLRAVVENYPRCLRGTEAKERMVDVARVMMDEHEEYTSQGLNNIAADQAEQARELLRLVDGRLLTNILSRDEMAWLRNLDLGDEAAPAAWINREAELAREVRLLLLQLTDEGNGD